MVPSSCSLHVVPGARCTRSLPLDDCPTNRHGLTLIEVMVSLAAAMVVLAAVISVLGMVTKGIADSRSMIEVTNRLRSAQVLLRNDLAGATSPGLVYQKSETGNGYFEIVEGNTSYDDNGTTTSINGDIDDMVAFTTRTSGSPFVGLAGANTITSPVAEVVWFLNPTPAQTYGDGTVVYNLHRRLFLVMSNISAINNQLTGANFNTHDVTFRQYAGNRIPCSLGDLAVRKYRVFHNNSDTTALTPLILTGTRAGEDIVLTNVIGFDVKVFDPTAPNRASGNLGLLPGDRGYTGSTTAAGNGAYVDLGKGVGSRFGIAMETKSKLSGKPTYDTWCFDYENDGIDTDGANGIDQYVNGLDDNGDGVIDDANERETIPPYPYALRGVQIKIRVYEPSSKQVREVTVEETFVP